MLAEADLRTSPGHQEVTRDAPHSIDCLPLRSMGRASAGRGFVASVLARDNELLMGRALLRQGGMDDGPDFILGPCLEHHVVPGRELIVVVDLCLSGPDDYDSGPASPRTAGAAGDEDIYGVSPLVAAEDDVADDLPARRSPSVEKSAPPSPNTFVASFKRGLDTPLLSTPILRITRRVRLAEDPDFVPKRSAQLATKSGYRELRPEAQARKVMMRRLGFEKETEVPDEASFEEFQELFKQPLTPSKREALDILFPGRKQRAADNARDC